MRILIKYKLVIVLIVSTFFIGCAGRHKAVERNSDFTVSEKRMVEFQYTFMEANRAKLLGDMHRAAALYQKCLEIHKNNDASAYELSNIFHALGDQEKAILFARKALENDKDNKWYYFQLARIYQIGGQTSKAVDVYKALVKRFPKDFNYQLTLAGLLSDDNQIAEGIKVLEEIEKNIGLSEQVSVIKHNLFVRNVNYEKAFNELQKLIDHYPDEIRFLGMLAELYGKLNMDKQAVDTYKKMLLIEPDNGLIHFSIAEYYAERGLLSEAFIHYARALKDDQIDLTEKVSALYALYNDSSNMERYSVEIGQLIEILVSQYRNSAEARFIGADFFIRAGNYNRAVIELKDLNLMQPENFGVAEQLVLILSFQEKYEELIYYAGDALQYFPDKSIMWYFYGIGLYQVSQYEKASDAFIRSLSKAQENDEIRINILLMLGDTFNKLYDYTQSDYYFNEILKIDDENSVALNNYSYYLAIRGDDLARAEKMSRSTIEKEPENSTYLDTYAWVLFKMGKVDDALIYIERAIHFLEEENAEIMEHYGDILFEKDELQKAIDMWKRAFELDVNRTDLLDKIKKHE